MSTESLKPATHFRPADEPVRRNAPPETKQIATLDAMKDVGLKLVQQAWQMPWSMQREAFVVAETLKCHQRNRPATIAVLTAPEHKAFLERSDTVTAAWDAAVEPYDKKDNTKLIANERKKAFGAIMKMAQIEDPERSRFDIVTFAQATNAELIELINARRLPGLSAAQTRAIATEEQYLKTILGWYNIASSDVILERFGLYARPKPDAARQQTNNEVKTLGRALVFIVTSGMALLSGLLSWKSGASITGAAIWGGLALGTVYWKDLMNSSVQRVLEKTAYLKDKSFYGFLSQFKPGALEKPVAALLETRNAETLAYDLNAKGTDPKTEKRRAAARQQLTEIITNASGNPQLAAAMLQNPQAFVNFIIPQLAVRKDEDARRLTMNCVARSTPPIDQFRQLPPPVS